MSEKTIEQVIESIDIPEETVPSNTFGSESHETYYFEPLEMTDEETGAVAAGSTLWLHWKGEWSWDFFNYKADVWAWVTKDSPKGPRVNVKRIEAHLRPEQCYGSQRDVRENSSSAHAKIRIHGVGVCKTGICGQGCAEQPLYGRWCAPEKCF